MADQWNVLGNPGGRLELLLVEDDETLASGLSGIVALSRRPRFQVTHVRSLAAAMTKVAEGRFDIAVVDLGLPDAEGVEAPRAFRATAPDLPVIVLTGSDDDGLVDECARSGVQDFLVKHEISGNLFVRSVRYAIERNRLVRQLREHSVRDELTGLYNRRGFFRLGQQQLDVAARLGRPALLLYADIDGMKSCNDTYGHDHGDMLLRKAGRALQRCFRSTDVIGRLGGDEFAVVSLDAGNASSAAFTARLSDAVRELNLSDSTPVELSMSVGLAFAEVGAAVRLDEMLKSADEWMYAHKKRRRETSP
jgi:two-component system cell cycle response regulator